MMKYNDFHYYIFDNSFYRVPVSHEEQTAEQYDKYHGFLPADRDQILCHGKRITFEEYIRGKTRLDLAGNTDLDSHLKIVAAGTTPHIV